MKSIFGKLGVIGLLIALFSGIVISCTTAPENTTPPTTQVTDQLGRTVTLGATPQRIVSLAPSNTEILYALGLADRVVGVTDYDNYPPEVKEKPSIGGFSTPNIEEVVARNPDLVLATSIHKDKIIPQLEARGLTIVALNPKTTDQVLEAIKLVGQVTRTETNAAVLVNGMQQRIKAVTDRTGSLNEAQKPRVFYAVWHDPMMAAGSGTLHDELIRLAGGTNIAHDLTGYADISLEAVIASNPQVMIAGVGMGTGEDLPYRYITTESRLAETDARKNNRVYAIDTDLVGRPELFKEQP
jgi:iron complex transport system substrate-binding protein